MENTSPLRIRICMICVCYLVGMAAAVHFPHASEYNGQAVLSPDEYELFWKLLPNSDSPKTISLAIHVKTAGCVQYESYALLHNPQSDRQQAHETVRTIAR